MNKKVVHNQNYQILVTSYPIDITNGTENSVEFFEMMFECRSDLIIKFKHIINWKYKLIQKMLLGEVLFYYILFAAFSLFLLDSRDKLEWKILLGVLNSLFFVKECLVFLYDYQSHM